jgi:hypothetical protein
MEHAKLIRNRIKLCKKEYPDSMLENLPNNLDTKLLGGIIPIENVRYKIPQLTPVLNVLTLEDTCSFLKDLDKMDDLETTAVKYNSPSTIHEEELKFSFGNSELATLSSHGAWIPVWNCDIDGLSTASSLTYPPIANVSTMGTSRTIEKMCESRQLLLGTKRNREEFFADFEFNRKEEGGSDTAKEGLTQETKRRKTFLDFGFLDEIDNENRSSPTVDFLPYFDGIKKIKQSEELVLDFTLPLKSSDFESDLLYSDMIYSDRPNSTELKRKITEMLPGEIFGNLEIDVECLIELKMAVINDTDTIKTHRELDLNLDSKASTTNDSEEIEFSGSQLLEDPWSSTVKVDMDNSKNRAKFQEFDILLSDSFSGGCRQTTSNIRDVNQSSLLFFCSLLQSNSISLPSVPDQSIPIPPSCDRNVADFQPKPISLKSRCKSLLSDDGTPRLLTDRLLNSTHALKCILIPPVKQTVSCKYLRYTNTTRDANLTDNMQSKLLGWGECEPSELGRRIIDLFHPTFKPSGEAPKGIIPENDHCFLPFQRRGIDRSSLLEGSPNLSFYSNLKDVCSFNKTISSHKSSEIRSLYNIERSDRRGKEDPLTKFLKLACLPSLFIGHTSLQTSGVTTEEYPMEKPLTCPQIEEGAISLDSDSRSDGAASQGKDIKKDERISRNDQEGHKEITNDKEKEYRQKITKDKYNEGNRYVRQNTSTRGPLPIIPQNDSVIDTSLSSVPVATTSLASQIITVTPQREVQPSAVTGNKLDSNDDLVVPQNNLDSMVSAYLSMHYKSGCDNKISLYESEEELEGEAERDGTIVPEGGARNAKRGRLSTSSTEVNCTNTKHSPFFPSAPNDTSTNNDKEVNPQELLSTNSRLLSKGSTFNGLCVLISESFMEQAEGLF